MSIHVCKQCGSRFEYCRACVFRPIRYKDKGYCSQECYEASKKVVETKPVVEEVVTVEIEEPIVENNNESSIENTESIEEEVLVETEPSVEEVETEQTVPVEAPIETTTVVEPPIKNETNTYKKKKNKYRYTSSY